MALKLDLSQASYPTTTHPRQEINQVAKIIFDSVENSCRNIFYSVVFLAAENTPHFSTSLTLHVIIFYTTKDIIIIIIIYLLQPQAYIKKDVQLFLYLLAFTRT
jgi:hypothetical protein